jgi:hypothetical protein
MSLQKAKKALERLSPSEMKGAIECPYNWYCGVLGYKRLPSDMTYANAGSAVHQAIAEYYQVIGDPPSKNSIRSTFENVLDRVWTKYGLDSVKYVSSRKRSAIDNFTSFELSRLGKWKNYKPSMTESKLEVNLRDITFATIVDAYWEQDETIIDWKTGKMNNLDEFDYIQGHIMTMVIRALNKPVSRVIFVCTTTGLRLEMPKIEDNFIFDRVDKLKEFAEKGKFPKRRGRHCGYCDNVIRCQLSDRSWHLWSEI